MCNANGRILVPSVMCVCMCGYKYNALYIYIKSVLSKIVISGY